MVVFFSLLIWAEELINQLTRAGTIATEYVRLFFLLFLLVAHVQKKTKKKNRRCSLVYTHTHTHTHTPPGYNPSPFSLLLGTWITFIYGCGDSSSKKLILSPTWLALCIQQAGYVFCVCQANHSGWHWIASLVFCSLLWSCLCPWALCWYHRRRKQKSFLWCLPTWMVIVQSISGLYENSCS